MPDPIVLATRRSKLAIAQAELTREHLAAKLPEHNFALLEMSTTGDNQQKWSLEERGGKGLFTKELEEALLSGEAQLAVHSAKDLPTEMPEGLVIAGYLPRATPNDVLVMRAGMEQPVSVATSSPRRRAQIERFYPDVEFQTIRGNVQTRLRKIAEDHEADATILAAAGLERLGIKEHPGLQFIRIATDKMVPATGQAAIAIQCREADAEFWREYLDAETRRAVEIERSYLSALGGGCHTAHAAHFDGERLRIFHTEAGVRTFVWDAVPGDNDAEKLERLAPAILRFAENDQSV